MNFTFARPFCSDDMTNIKVFAAALSNVHCHQSFPSGHTAYSCTLLFSLWPVLNTGTRMFGIFLAGSVAISRIASGVHFPADLLWAAIISATIVSITQKLVDKATKILSPHIVEIADHKF